MTVGQFNRAVDGYNKRLELDQKRLEAQSKETDRLNHILGQYIAIGVNNPKKYPKQPYLSNSKPKTQSPEEFRQMMKQRYGKKE